MNILRIATIFSTMTFMIAKLFQIIYQSQVIHMANKFEVNHISILLYFTIFLCSIDLLLGCAILFGLVTNKKNLLNVASFIALLSLVCLILLLQIGSVVYVFRLEKAMKSGHGYEDMMLANVLLPAYAVATYGITLGGIFIYSQYTTTS